MGHVTSRVDVMHQTTNYSYDTYNRLTQVARTGDGCQTENYTYDQTIDNSFPSGSSLGKLTAVTFGGPDGYLCPSTQGSSSWGGLAYEYQYSWTGQVTGKRMAVGRSGYIGGLQVYNLDAHWTYDNEGRPVSVTYPVVNDPNTGNRLRRRSLTRMTRWGVLRPCPTAAGITW